MNGHAWFGDFRGGHARAFGRRVAVGWMMAAPAHYLADEAKREAKAELRAELVRALRDVGACPCISSSSGLPTDVVVIRRTV
jgi:hypothetical protein